MSKKVFWTIAAVLAISNLQLFAFCGFYVAKADASLFNNKSEVILVRDGNRTTVTMSSDFKGDVRDFAMVVPVPVLLKESDIRVVNRNVFSQLDNYSAPRLTEYYDQNPCELLMYEELDMTSVKSVANASTFERMALGKADRGVTIEARYQVGEYDILLLSAAESEGLQLWLTENGYKIPEKAAEVLAPYIKSKMKFFVVKVNLEKLKNKDENYLSPLQITFDSPKFMLPIRLGMANSAGTQDMIVYAFSRQGRVECTNYRTVKMPTDRNIPLFVQSKFGEFYSRVFNRTYQYEGRNAVFLEYAWDVTPNYGMKCDPCVGPPPMQQEFVDAGVGNWIGGRIFFTRLHVRYDRAHFPNDLVFQETPNNEYYQARYVITHPAAGSLDCEEGKTYLASLNGKRKLEVDELTALTGKSYAESAKYLNEFKSGGVVKKGALLPFSEKNNEPMHPFVLLLSLSSVVFVSFKLYQRLERKYTPNV
jgi:hypothetical protein